ncbi:phosphomevalonate kinase [Streptomyces sp. NPDC127098]|uniref:phosphomevalonate kinase n=1 Tax=Streptomyces sp. NPDC127098 TaxID=3347137 RepID=UPI0036640BEE
MWEPVTRRAPGKLLVAGEYAVLEPGRPAIVVAVDRYVTVTASAAEGADVVVDTDLLDHEVPFRRDRGRLRTLAPADTEHARGTLAHLVSTVEVVERLRAEQGLPLTPLRLTVRSGLHERGVKVGLGSSAAVTVATTEAVTDLYGMRLPREDRFRLALLSSVRIDAGPSGADLAASTWHGWIAYRAPDRGVLRRSLRHNGVSKTLASPWPDLSIRTLPPPRGLDLRVGWSGSPASTSALVADLTASAWWRGTARTGFLAESERCVTAGVRALERGEPDGLLDAVRTARHLLARMDAAVSLGLFTERLTRLCDAAEACGGAAKPSGAGGGDCGIALLPDRHPPSALRTRWARAGITTLPLRVTDPPSLSPRGHP